MSRPTHLNRAARTGVALAVSLAFAAVPAAAQAAPVGLGTADPFVVLGGASVTNTGPSVLNGDLGVSPGTALNGFGAATVNGATHQNDAVASLAQNDLTTAYDVAAGQPVLPGNDLTGQDLGNKTLTAGTYRFSSSAGLTGQLTLDAQGDPRRQFVFQIGSALTTASASSVVLVNGASPCNVFWQVGSSATLGTTTAFQGNLMTLASITSNNGTTVQGSLLARTGGSVTLDNTVINGTDCRTATETTPGDTTTPTDGGTPTVGAPADGVGGTPNAGAPTGTPGAPVTTPARPPASQTRVPTRRGTARLTRTPSARGTPTDRCTTGFSATVRGREIKRVVFTLDGRRIASRTGSPFRVSVRALSGRHNVRARVTFKDDTRARTLSLGYRACAAAVLKPRRGPSKFTG